MNQASHVALHTWSNPMFTYSKAQSYSFFLFEFTPSIPCCIWPAPPYLWTRLVNFCEQVGVFLLGVFSVFSWVGFFSLHLANIVGSSVLSVIHLSDPFCGLLHFVYAFFKKHGFFVLVPSWDLLHCFILLFKFSITLASSVCYHRSTPCFIQLTILRSLLRFAVNKKCVLGLFFICCFLLFVVLLICLSRVCLPASFLFGCFVCFEFCQCANRTRTLKD